MNLKALACLAEAISNLEPPIIRTGAEWADEHQKTSSFKSGLGEIDLTLTPWSYEISKAMESPDNNVVVIIQGAQTCKSQTLLNHILHVLYDDPHDILYVMPTETDANGFSNRRITPMLRSVPFLAQKITKNNVQDKIVNGASIKMAWAGSGPRLRTDPFKIVIVDEYDIMKPVRGEGDLLGIVKGRINTFADGKVILASTCTQGIVGTYIDPDTGMEHWESSSTEVTSPIWKVFQNSTRYEWAIPDIEGCNEYFIPRLSHFHIPEDLPPREAAEKSYLVCPNCQRHIYYNPNWIKNANFDYQTQTIRGRFIAPGMKVDKHGNVTGTPPVSSTAGFWTSGFCSSFPGNSWTSMIEDYVLALRNGDLDALQAIINTKFAELFARLKQRITYKNIVAQMLPYQYGTVPDGVAVLTAGADVGDHEIHYSVHGWGEGMEHWLIEKGIIEGETNLPETWNHLSNVLDAYYGDLYIECMGVDSGHNPKSPDEATAKTDFIYDFCSRHHGRAIPIKGERVKTKPFEHSIVDFNYKGEKKKYGVDLYSISTDYFKSALHGRFTWDCSRVGAWHIPTSAPDFCTTPASEEWKKTALEYCKQIASETRTVDAQNRAFWKKTYRKNHFFDCLVYARAAAKKINLEDRLPMPTSIKTETNTIIQPEDNKKPEKSEQMPDFFSLRIG